MFIKPAPWPDDPTKLMVVRDPVSMVPLPPEGKHVPDTDLHWHRLWLQGDVVKAEPPVEGAATGQPRVEIQPNADGTATFLGDHPAEQAAQSDQAHAQE